MNRILNVTGALAALLVAAAWLIPATAAPEQKRGLAETTLTVEGMTCGGCVAKVKARLKKIEGVYQSSVDLKNGEAHVSYDPGRTSPDALAAAVSETGFKAKVKGKKDDGEKVDPEAGSET